MKNETLTPGKECITRKKSVVDSRKDLISRAKAMLNPCHACPRLCLVNRLTGEKGFCRAGALAKVSSAGAHFGEESVLVGPGGSGTVFFQGCNLHCAYCQNCHISQQEGGMEVTPESLARVMVSLQQADCSNINLVTPTHVAPQVLESVIIARRSGLSVPIVYNCGGYESVEMLQLFDGYVDIFMPDFKYAEANVAMRYSQAEDYPEIARSALAEMFRQVGPLELNDQGLAVRGLIVRHLVLPMDIGQAEKVIDIVADVAPGCAMSILGQYRPAFRAAEYPELLVLPTPDMVKKFRRYAVKQGLVPIS